MRRTFIKFYTILLACFLTASILFGAVYKNAIDEVSENYLGDLLATVLNLIGTELHELPPEQWKTALQERHLDTTFNLDIQPASTYELDPESTIALNKGEIIALTNDNMYLQKIQDSDYILIAGPVSYAFFLEQIEWMDYILFIAIALSLAIPVYLWMRPHWRDLSTLETAAKNVRKGDLTTQVQLNPRSDVQPIGLAFNQMTRSIQELIARQDTLIHDIAHEVRTPLARLRYRLALQDTPDPATAQMQDDIDDIDSLIEELLLRARIDSSPADRQSFPALAWLDERVAQAALNAAPHLMWQAHAEPSSGMIQADAILITRALDNLLNNAKRFAQTTVIVRWTASADYQQLTVEDDGEGIPIEQRTHVFQPFMRLDNSRTRATGGHGLGLAIVASIAKAHGGHAHVTDSPLGGALFSIQWPTI